MNTAVLKSTFAKVPRVFTPDGMLNLTCYILRVPFYVGAFAVVSACKYSGLQWLALEGVLIPFAQSKSMKNKYDGGNGKNLWAFLARLFGASEEKLCISPFGVDKSFNPKDEIPNYLAWVNPLIEYTAWLFGASPENQEEVNNEFKKEVNNEFKEEVNNEFKEEVNNEFKEEVNNEFKEEVNNELKQDFNLVNLENATDDHLVDPFCRPYDEDKGLNENPGGDDSQILAVISPSEGRHP